MKWAKISKWDWTSIFWGTFLVVCISLAGISKCEDVKYLNGECRYEIAIHTNTVWAQNFVNHFYFVVNDRKYYAGNKGLIKDNYEGKPYRYVVRYAVADPSKNEVYMKAPVPRYVKSAPPGG